MAGFFKKGSSTLKNKWSSTRSAEKGQGAEQPAKEKPDLVVCPACKKELIKSDVKDNK